MLSPMLSAPAHQKIQYNGGMHQSALTMSGIHPAGPQAFPTSADPANAVVAKSEWLLAHVQFDGCNGSECAVRDSYQLCHCREH